MNQIATCKVTPKGIEAFENYVKVLQEYLQVGKVAKPALKLGPSSFN